MDKAAVQQTLNPIKEFELAGVVRYTHYALMVYGYNRTRDKNMRLEAYARDMIAAEMAHQDEVDKMLRKPGQTEAFSER